MWIDLCASSSFEREGYNVKCIDDAMSLMSVMIKCKPNLVILDVQIGRFDGRALCEHLKKFDQTKQIPIVMMSAKANILEMNGYNCRAEEYVNKPFDIVDLANKVEYYLNKESLCRQKMKRCPFAVGLLYIDIQKLSVMHSYCGLCSKTLG